MTLDVADVAHLLAAAEALILAVTCCAGLVYAQGWDQRLRFAVLLGYAAITVNGQLENLGRAPTWRTYALVVIGLVAVISTGAYVVRNVRRNSDKGVERAGRADDQRSVFRPGAGARRNRSADHRTRPTGDGTAT